MSGRSALAGTLAAAEVASTAALVLVVGTVSRIASLLAGSPRSGAPREPGGGAGSLRSAGMGLADTFQRIVDSLPDDWTDLELDLRIAEESRYVEASVYLVTCNAQPYSYNDWHWRLLVAHRFGHAAAAPTVHGTLRLLDDAGIEG